MWFALLAILVLVFPAFITIFDDFDRVIPTITLLAVWASDLLVAYWYATLPLIGGLCVANLLVFHVLGTRPGFAVLSWLWLARISHSPYSNRLRPLA